MYVILDPETELFYAGYVCGCVVWKRHVSRASMFETIADARHDAEHANLSDYIEAELIRNNTWG